VISPLFARTRSASDGGFHGRAGKVIRKRIRHDAPGVHVVGDVNAVVSTNVKRGGGVSSVSSRQRIVQKSTARADSREEPDDDRSGPNREHGASDEHDPRPNG
jgi:hypothetical protein